MTDRAMKNPVCSCVVFATVLLAVLLLIPTQGFALENGDSVDTSPPHPVVVETLDGRELTGMLYRISADTVQVYSERIGGVFLTADDVKAVHPARRATLKYAVVGTALGAATVLCLDIASHRHGPYDHWDTTVYLFGGAFGLIAGAGIGSRQWSCDYRHDIWDQWRIEHGIHVSLAF